MINYPHQSELLRFLQQQKGNHNNQNNSNTIITCKHIDVKKKLR